MATGVGLAQISLAINSYWVQEWGSYLPYNPSYCRQGSVGVNLKDTVRLADPENPEFGANSVQVSSKVPEL